MAIFLRSTLVVAVVFLVFLLTTFYERTQVSDQSAGLPRLAIVFTGQFDRVRLGLRLIEEGQIEKLFISGVNPGAGINMATFADQFELSPVLRGYLKTSKIVLASSAQSTIENAIESVCWLNDEPFKSAFLITSKSHMARAYLALKEISPGVFDIRRFPVSDASRRDFDFLYVREFLKYSATWLKLTVSKFSFFGDEFQPCEV